MKEARITQYSFEQGDPFNAPESLPASREEHLNQLIEHNNRMTELLLGRRADVVSELAGIDQQIYSMRRDTWVLLTQKKGRKAPSNGLS